MTSPDRITVSRSKRGTTIKATGRSAQALFDALAGSEAKPTAESVASQVVAWCWATGLIEIGPVMPEGAIEIVRGPAVDVEHAMEVSARHGYGGQLLVPGIPETQSQRMKGNALRDWIKWFAPRSRPSLAWNPKALAEASTTTP